MMLHFAAENVWCEWMSGVGDDGELGEEGVGMN